MTDAPRVRIADAIATTIDDVIAALEASRGVVDSSGPLGDAVDIGSHSLQCAEHLAQSHPDDPELIVAGLVHDLGHVISAGNAISSENRIDHGRSGAAFVRDVLGPRVARLVELHVPAKRYLVATDRAYQSILSNGSTASLVVQGGAMSPTEIREFESERLSNDAMVLRRADEAAKQLHGETTSPTNWRPLLEQVAQLHQAAR